MIFFNNMSTDNNAAPRRNLSPTACELHTRYLGMPDRNKGSTPNACSRRVTVYKWRS